MDSKNLINTMLLSFLTGVMLSIAGTAFLFLSSINKLGGAFLFSFGLFAILNFGLMLFTGKVGYIVENKPSYIGTVALVWLGNLLGSIFAAFLVMRTRYANEIRLAALNLCLIKMKDSNLSLVVLGFFCGMLMFIAADGFKNLKNPVAQVFVVVMPVMTFIMCGFEHSIANMFYFSVAGWTPRGFACLLLITLGNALGGMFFPLIRNRLIKS